MRKERAVPIGQCRDGPGMMTTTAGGHEMWRWLPRAAEYEQTAGDIE